MEIIFCRGFYLSEHEVASFQVSIRTSAKSVTPVVELGFFWHSDDGFCLFSFGKIN